MNDPVSMKLDGNVAVITADNPPVNALSHAVRLGVQNALEQANADPAVSAIVLRCEGRTFFAGADIREFGKPPKAPSLRELIEPMEAGNKPVVAALHGTPLGGGFETALCCHYRIAAPSTRVGLPEVNLGILPGAGGTQRTPRLAGYEASLDLMIKGAPIPAQQALELGLIDEISGEDLVADAVAAARRLGSSDTAPRRVSEIPLPVAKDGFFDSYRERIASKTRGLLSPEKIIECVQGAGDGSFADGLVLERRCFEECLASPQSAGLRHIFFAERQVSRVPGIEKTTARRAINSVGIVGAGTMGGGIAMVFANAGFPVTLVEASTENLDRGMSTIKANYEASAKRGRMSPAEANERIARITPTTSLDDLADADLVVEAVFENMDVKRQVFSELDRICRDGAILATNTSTLDVDEIAAATARPHDVVGLHFFSPANVMRLLEIVRARDTSEDTLATCVDLAKRIGKTGVVSGVCFGFIGNRMFEGYLRENNFMLLEGMMPDHIDRQLYDYGMAMGPNGVSDLAGLDVPYRIREELRASGKLPKDARYGRATDTLVEAGRFGQKNRLGIFSYEAGRNPEMDQTALDLMASEAVKLGVQKRTTSDDDITLRVMLPLINEGARILEEGIALRPGDIDTVWTAGYGFPRHRGGPMFDADRIGPGVVRDHMQRFADTLGNEHGYWDIAPLLDELAGNGKNFSSL